MTEAKLNEVFGSEVSGNAAEESSGLTRRQLIRRLAERFADLSRADVALSVKVILGAIEQAMVAGDRVEIRNFGHFEARLLRARTRRNPRTGESLSIGAKRRPVFKPSWSLIRRLNQWDSAPGIRRGLKRVRLNRGLRRS